MSSIAKTRNHQIGVPATTPYWSWAERFARHQRTTKAILVDQALAAYAESRGFDAPPQR